MKRQQALHRCRTLIFTAFSDTADYLYQHVSAFVQQEFALNTAEITGMVDGKTTISYRPGCSDSGWCWRRSSGSGWRSFRPGSI